MNAFLVHGFGALEMLVQRPWAVLGMCLPGALVGGLALLAEWQRRATLLALVCNAPSGTVVVQERGRGGPAMRVHVGGSVADEGGHG